MSHGDHLFMYLLAICMYSWDKCLFRSFPHFLIELFAFLVLTCMSCLYILEINPLSVVSFAIIFSHSEGCLFTLFIVSFALQKLLSLIRAHLLTFVFISLFPFMHWRRKWQPTPVFLPGESQGRGSLVDCHLWGCTESDTTEVT